MHFRLAAAPSPRCRSRCRLIRVCVTVTCVAQFPCPRAPVEPRGRGAGASVLLVTPPAHGVNPVRAHRAPMSLSIDELVTFYLSSPDSSIDIL